MAKKQRVNKTQVVKEFLKSHPEAKNKEVAEALGKNGIKITPNYIGNIKANAKKQPGRGRATAANHPVGVPQIKAALAFVRGCGSVRAAKDALAAAEEIRVLV